MRYMRCNTDTTLLQLHAETCLERDAFNDMKGVNDVAQ